ncbi:MAG: single-stranded DNA-binding protein [Planctomycetota bacterium]|jgi:single-stranded DNA-binding protein
MVDSKPIRNGQPTRPSVYLAGELSKQTVLVDLAAQKTVVARPVIRVGEEEIELVAEGALARRFANTLKGTPVMVAGSLVVRHWETAGGQKHQRFEIEVERMIP